MEWLSMIIGALLIALLIGAIFSVGGIRGPGDSLLTFFVVLFLGSLAIGAWLDPVGPLAFGFPWVSFMVITLFLGLLVAASTPTDQARRRRIKHFPLQRDTGTEPTDATDATTATGLFFWVFLLATFAIIAVRFFELVAG